jgi:hypothetical protein
VVPTVATAALREAARAAAKVWPRAPWTVAAEAEGQILCQLMTEQEGEDKIGERKGAEGLKDASTKKKW